MNTATPYRSPLHRPSPAAVLGAAVCLLALAALPAHGQDRVLAEIDNIYAEEVRADGFVLDRAQEVTIEAIGPARRRSGQLLGNAWVLDAGTREVVWSLAEAAGQDHSRDLLDEKETLRLPAGAYEVYYASYVLWDGDSHDSWEDTNSLGDLVRNLIDEIFDADRDWRDWEEAYRREARDAGITVRARSGRHEANAARLADPFLERAFLTLTSPGNDYYVQQGFVVKRTMDVAVYALGELDWDAQYDYGWIVNTDTRERVWTMQYANTEAAGGAKKNRVARDVVRLEEGNYAAYFTTDGSHTAEDWNAAPPYDPDFWGLTLRTRSKDDLRFVALQDYENVRLSDAIVALRGLGDDERVSQGFRLRAPMDVRIYALGEGSGDEMHDYGWIIDADTREPVWTMRFRDTDHAGGADKNRLVDRVIHLEAGTYIAYFETDYAHAFGDFNSAAPYDAEAWGLTLVPAGDRANVQAFGAFEEATDAATLAQIIRVEDDADLQDTFTLRRDTAVRIYALGEGSGGDMYDYGWIENDRGEVVWEMTYRMTDHAGGADKNRVVNRTILLPAGTYTAHYQSDSSHDYSDWNARAPHDPTYWGITLRRAGE